MLFYPRIPQGASINKVLRNYAQLAENLYAEFNGEINPDTFKEELECRSGRKKPQEEEEEKPITFFEFVDNYIASEKGKPNGLRGTWKKYETVINHVKTYHKETKAAVNFDDINWQFRTDFEKWLYSPPRSHSSNNVSKIFQVIKKFMKLSHREGFHTNDIYKESDFGVKRVKVKSKIRLTPEEVDMVMAEDFSYSPHNEKVRDMFIAACFSGLRISDWKSINREHIIYLDFADIRI